MAKVFFSYSHKDEALRDQLEAHLALLLRQGLIESWHDRRIVAGSDIESSIDDALEKADVILLLVSADFLASTYCYSKEMQRAMERHVAQETRVIPVILRDCDWHSAPFGKLLAAPQDGRPVTLWPDIDQAFADVAKKVRRALDERNKAGSDQLTLPPSGHAGQTRAVAPREDTSPRSSNLRVRKDFTEKERQEFARSGFEFIVRFFAGSLQALEERNPRLTGSLDRIDSRRFAATVFKEGKIASACSIRLDVSERASVAIAFSYDPSAREGTYNELLQVEANPQTLFFKPLGMQLGHPAGADQLSLEGAAEFLWGLLISRLQ